MNKITAIGALFAVAWVVSAGAAPRFAPLPASEWSAEQQQAIAAFAPIGLSNLAASYAQHPALPQILLPHLRYVLAESTLPPRQRSLVALRTAWLARSPYLWAHLAPIARRAALTDGELERIARGPDADGWEPFEAVLLRVADELFVDSIISDASWAALRENYDIPQLIDTVDTVGALILHAGVANTLGVEIETGVADRPPEIPYVTAAEKTNFRLVGKAPRIPPAQTSSTANVFNTFRHHPPADRVRGAINNHVNRALEPRHRELLVTRIGVLCRSEYEYAAHVRSGRRYGFTDADVALLLAGPDAGLDAAPFDLALLGATDELYRDVAIGTDTWATLAATFDPPQLLDVLIAVGGYRSTSMLINTAGVQLDENMAEYRFPQDLR